MKNILNYLKENGITETITIGSLKDENGVGLFTASGLEPTFYFDDTTTEYKGLQVIVRNESYAKCEDIINIIFSLLNKLEGYKPEQSPFSLGKDEKGRSEFSVNYIITKEGVK